MKLLKTLMATILMATALTAKAEEVPQEKTRLYINAVIAQIKAQDAKCPLFKGDKLERSQEWADAHQVFITDEGTSITIRRQRGDRAVLYNVRTKSDKKTIIYAIGAVVNLVSVNVGTLAEPQESSEWVADPKSVIYCDFDKTN
ncbi:MAG: hypothetical protein JSU04_19695 [Bdellovibrionales bacterium]|nr:hypothetical protein [Bdellovibrionales bacterium]